MPQLYFEQLSTLREQVWSNTNREPSDQQLDELLETFVRVGDDIDEALLCSAGKVIFGDQHALADVDLRALNAILPQLRESRRKALEIWRPEWFRAIKAASAPGAA